MTELIICLKKVLTRILPNVRPEDLIDRKGRRL